MSSELFGVSQVANPKINMATGEVTADVSHPFMYPLTLAFFQFAFMGVIFLTVWALSTRSAADDVAGVKENLASPQWGGLVA